MNARGKGKVILGFAMAAIIVASVFALMAGSVGAYSVGGEYNIIEKDDGGAITIEADTTSITVSEKSVAFDVPPIAIIGDKTTIRGTATSGTYISVFLDDILYSQLWNLVIEDGEFSKEVRTTDIGMWRFGIAELKAYIDCDKRPGEDRPSRSPDGVTKVFMVPPWLTASLSTDSVDQEGDFVASGSAPGSTEVVILCVPPRGGVGKSLLDKGMKGLSPRKASVSTTTDTYTKKMTVQEDADSGVYYIIVLSSVMDGMWDMTGQEDLETALHMKYNIPSLTTGIINVMTQDLIIDIFEDLTQSPGSDDLMQILTLKVGDIAMETLTLGPIADVVVGNPLVVNGETRRKDGSIIWITVKRQYQEIVPQAAIAKDNTFSATFNTTGAQPGTYTVKANDGYCYTSSTTVNIIAGAQP
jgi:hypothetical protein